MLAEKFKAFKVKDIREDVKGEGMTGRIIGIAIALFIAGVIIPSALVTIANSTLTGVDPSVQTMFTVLLPIMAVVGIILMFVRYQD